MAELRLAMVTMGKAMGEWLDVIREGAGSTPAETAEAWRGLDRVRDGLLDAAGNDVEDLVQAWAWNDGLDSSRSRGATPVTPSMVSPRTRQSLPRARARLHP
jgi:TBC1 domain family protein 5